MKFDQSQISRFFARDRFLRPYDRPPFASKVNRRHPLALGLVGCWLLNEGAGNKVLDSSGNRNDLSNNGALWIKDHRGGVLDFASPDYGLIADHDSLDLTDTGTIIVKARLDSLSTNHTLVCKKDDAAYDAATGFCFTVEMPFERFYLYGSGANWLISDVVTPYLDTTNYHQFAANWKDSVGALFLDGIDRTESSSITTPVANTKDLYIGRWDFHSIFLDGKIEFVYIFNRQLLNSEISSIYQEPYQFIQPPQIARQFFVPAVVTTAAPTTPAPTTAAPTSLAPTTAAPTSLAPTTLAPTSLAPTSLAPTTYAITTYPPSTAPPTSLAPTTAAPTSLAPTTPAPTSLAPTSLAPTSLAPTSLAPTSLAPTSLAPTTSAPTSLAPTSLAPTSLAPTTLAPTTLAPTTLAPTTLAPTTLAPTSLAPTSLAPTSLAPTTAAPVVTSYLNPDGSGPRQASIVASSDMGWVGDIYALLDGITGAGIFWGTDADISGDYLRFEFLEPVVIDEALWYQSNSTTHGIVRWQGSNNGVDWDNIGGTFALGGSSPQTQDELNGNTTFYKYYQLLGVSGIISSSPYIYEIEFKTGVNPYPRYLDELGVGDRTGDITASNNGFTGTSALMVNDLLDNALWLTGLVSGKWLKFDFGLGVILTEVCFVQTSGASHGDWKWQGSNNDSDWDDIGSSFTVGGATRQLHTELNGNGTPYRYYRLLGVSGSGDSGPYWQDFLFQLDEPLTTAPPTTLGPTTLAPTTPAPTSLAPTTAAPTTSAPTTVAPTTQAPTTLAPTSLAPTTIAPTTLAPTTIAPTTVAPTTVAPTTVAPTSLAPTSLPPTTVAPTTVPATTVVPTTLAPTTLAVTTPVPISPEEWCYLVDSPITDGGVLLSPMTDGGILSSPITDGGILLSILENDGCAL